MPPFLFLPSCGDLLKQATVLLVPSGRRYNAVVIPADTEQFPPGHALLLNLTRSRPSILCNRKETARRKPGEHRLVAAVEASK